MSRIQATPLFTHLQLALVLVAPCLLAGPAMACSMRTVAADKVTVPVEGRIVQAFSCKDLDGDHLFVETRHQPAGTGRSSPVELSFYKFTMAATGYTRRWQARDFASVDEYPGLRPHRPPRVDRFVTRDVDGDGLAEAFVSYTLPGQGMNPDDGKLLVFYKDRKYAIRGAVANGPTDFGSRTLDAGFATLPASVQSFALQLWDAVALPRGMSTGVTLSQASAP